MKHTLQQLNGLKHASAAASLSIASLTLLAVSVPITGTLHGAAKAGRWAANKLDAGASKVAYLATEGAGKLAASASRHQAEAMFARQNPPAPEEFSQAATA